MGFHSLHPSCESVQRPFGPLALVFFVKLSFFQKKVFYYAAEGRFALFYFFLFF